jgi:2-(1,2-epoxy-1,2-dihydrophenyl)acetyl-CoA isomerase
MMDARRIEALGLANRVVPDAALETQTMELASRLANGPAVALRYIKHNLNVADTGSLAQSFDSEAFGMLRCRESEDHKEASRAFVEKRPPVFKGR